jgi:hypothetical protein
MRKWIVMGTDPTGREVDTTGRIFYTRRGAKREKRAYDTLAAARICVPHQGRQVPLVSYAVQEQL